MIIKEYIENEKNYFELKFENEILASEGFIPRDLEDYIYFENNEKINFNLLSKIRTENSSDLKLYFGIMEKIIIHDVIFFICPIEIENSKVKIGIIYNLSDNYFESNYEIKKLTKALKNFNTEQINIYKIYSEDSLESYEIVWEAIFEFKEEINHYIDIIKFEFSKIITKEILKENLAWKKTYATDELLFTKEILIPLFSLMGFKSVRFNHGTQEFGKDITFYDFDKFNGIEYYGVQVKAGDLNGRSNSKINEILSQIDDIIKIPFRDIDSNREQYISKIIIAISGEFKENAKIKLLNHVPEYLKGSIKFIDKPKIISLIEEVTKNNAQQRTEIKN